MLLHGRGQAVPGPLPPGGFHAGCGATEKVVARGRERCRAEGLESQISFTLADVCDSGLPSASVDFVWGEDAWCYVVDKAELIAEAVC